MTRRSYVQDPETGKLVPKHLYRRAGPTAPAVIPDIEPFVSPVDRQIIGSRTRLRQHNAEHGVAQHQEYGENNGQAYFQAQERQRQLRLQGQLPEQRRERLQAVIEAVNRTQR